MFATATGGRQHFDGVRRHEVEQETLRRGRPRTCWLALLRDWGGRSGAYADLASSR